MKLILPPKNKQTKPKPQKPTHLHLCDCLILYATEMDYLRALQEQLDSGWQKNKKKNNC